MPFPFEVTFSTVEADLDTFVDEVFGALQSEFLTLPRGEGFIDYPAFEQAYEALKRTTGSFRDLSPESIIETVYRVPLVVIVLRTMLGFTPPEWAYVATQYTDCDTRQVRVVRYTSTCAICGATVYVHAGSPDFPRRMVGRCAESPREHVLSFDRVTKKGVVLVRAG